MPEPIEIATEHGPAVVFYDARSDPNNPGWVLRYHDGVQQVDTILDADEVDAHLDARDEALAVLAREGVKVLGG